MMCVKTAIFFGSLAVAVTAFPEDTRLHAGANSVGLEAESTGLVLENGISHSQVGLEVESTGLELENAIGHGTSHGQGQGVVHPYGVGHGNGLGTDVEQNLRMPIDIGAGNGGSYGGPSHSCRYWCRTPKGQAYCCEGGDEPLALPSVKPGQCPPVRLQCPPVRYFGPPIICSNDSKCPGSEKCCYDTCLEHHTCKTPLHY
ncbi:hypothetical protein SK128_007987 [Halocaridina rubra]|uniref:WAP domain-containing protein n=1 Tax=Halocaridina rubra TaxID=373956 RepID=A0AAN8WN37_HALRR